MAVAALEPALSWEFGSEFFQKSKIPFASRSAAIRGVVALFGKDPASTLSLESAYSNEDDVALEPALSWDVVLFSRCMLMVLEP